MYFSISYFYIDFKKGFIFTIKQKKHFYQSQIKEMMKDQISKIRFSKGILI